MKIEQLSYTPEAGWTNLSSNDLAQQAQLVLCFGATALIKDPAVYQELKDRYPQAHLVGCSSAGEILDTEVRDDSVAVTAIYFEKTQVRLVKAQIESMNDSFSIGHQLAESLPKKDLTHIFVLSDGLQINGSELVHGITQSLPNNVSVTGGLSADGSDFKETYVIAEEPGQQNRVALVGFYGSHLRIGYSSLGGWDILGEDHVITKSEGNILYELDGRPALELYKWYVGDKAKDLPGSGLLYPLSIRAEEGDEWVVRTILGIDEEKNALIFAGDMNQGYAARLMRADFERLIEGAQQAANITRKSLNSPDPDLAILISCVGRKLVLQDRIAEEVAGVRHVYGLNTPLCGFYSYGEISPFTPNAKCELHNQTMTITTMREKL